MRGIVAMGTILSAGLLLTGCGAGGGGEAGGCPTKVSYTGSSGESVELTHGLVVSLGGGSAYTLYAADFELDGTNVSAFTGPAVADDGTMVTLAATVFNGSGEEPAIEAGTTVEASTASGQLVLVATANEGATLLGNNAGAGGELTFDKVGDAVCATVDYRDDEKSITGTVGGAPTSVG